ncbi:hypothetical protein [Pseudomonas sp. LS-2]|uniref:hypothetical protein n=1 Tax=Pseudomonas sp. LS-2 TaxID=2315859 RepID=UPI0010585814|nr:hypothetical protein [Pseudomonas sp. LS-2]
MKRTYLAFVMAMHVSLGNVAQASDISSIEADLASAISQHDERAAGVSLAELRSRACAGDPVASASIGRMYLFGNGLLSRDIGKARPFLSAGANGGVPRAASDLAISIISSSAAQGDLEEAAKWVKVSQFIDGEVSAQSAAALLRLAAGQTDLTAGFQAGARWIQLFRTAGGLNEEQNPCAAG